MASKAHDPSAVVTISGKWVSWAHTVVAYAAFIGAFVVGVWLHYQKIVQNEHFGYPDEWFPSVSATIGDRYPERSVFMIFIAITSGPRFLLVFLWYLLTARRNATLPKFVAWIGLFRTITCGGWTYVTSTDDHDWHDIFMISYLVATLPWTLGCIALSPNNSTALRYRKYLAGAFFGTLVPMIYFFIRHKVHRVAGAYTIYAFFEWSLVLLDVAFDAVTALDFAAFELVVRDVTGASRGGSRKAIDEVREMEKDKPIATAMDQPFQWSDALDAVADIYNGFVFWTLLTSLGLVVWYFPLWHMGISGYEAFVMSTVSPFFLGIGPFQRLVVQNIRTVHLLSLSGLFAYLIKKPELRLTCVGFAVSMACLAWSATWSASRAHPIRLERRALAWNAGLILSAVAKFAFHTSNPVWPIVHGPNGGWNKTGIVLAILAVLRGTRRTAPSSGDFDGQRSTRGSSVLAGLGLAGLFFGLHSMLSDSSTMILWVWEGHPVRGPIAVHGVIILLAMGAGVAASGIHTDRLQPRNAFVLLGAGAFLVTAFKHWTGFLGAVLVAFCLSYLSPHLIMSAARSSPSLAFGLGFLFYNVLVLAHVWVVAYAFVPGGPLMREHTDWVMTAWVLLTGIGVWNAADAKRASSGLARKPRFWRASAKLYLVYVLTAIELLAVAIAYLRFPTNDYTPYHPETRSLTAGIWTIHFSLDNDMYSSEYRMRDLIREMEIDVIGLLESDLQRIIMGNRDTTQFLAEDLGMYVDYGPGPNKHTWGSALLSRFPILNSAHHLLPSPKGELAPAIHATLDAYGSPVDVVVFHSGQEEDPEDRRLQSEYLADLMRASPRPTILLSYLVTRPHEGNYHTYVGERSSMRDIDPTDHDRWCEYILYKGLRRTGYARVSRSTITDTELQVGKFVVGEPEGGNDNDMIDESEVVEGLRFPERFRGEGVRGHRYHVFDAPRYFAE